MLAGILLLSGTAFGTVIRRASLTEYVAQSTVIVHAVVLKTTPVFPERGMPHTIVELAVLDWVKSDPEGRLSGTTLQVLVPGASDGITTSTVAESPAFAEADEVVLFLYRHPERGHLLINGLSQGTYRVFRQGTAPVLITGLHAEKDESIEAFKSRVRKLATETR